MWSVNISVGISRSPSCLKNALIGKLMSLTMKCLQLSFIQTALWVLHCLHKLMISSVNMYVNVCVFGELQSVALVLFI